jgi:glycerol-3-phosphate dehydrogenase
VALPERLGVEMILDTESETGARAWSYTELVGAEGDALLWRDRLTGVEGRVRPRVVVNATGAWVDRVGPILTPGRNERRVQGTKGSHLMIRSPELLAALDGRMIYHENADGRICIVFDHLGLAMVGSTDIRVDDPDAALCHEDEKAYMLEALRRVFPDIAITDDQIVHVFTGVRPLPTSPEGATARISRDHAVELDHDGDRAVLTLIGGKWTTFRAFGAEVADAALAQLGLPRRRGTEDMPIGGGRGLPPADRREGWIREEAGRAALPTGCMAELVMRYGTRAVAVARFLAEGPDTPLEAAPDHTRRELQWIIATRKCAIFRTSSCGGPPSAY